ncbi:MAG: hypothetical protein E7413_05975 [Ruminococcaceae bacterium]|nr:hypothetical protein [Oscillospiraceae bacterium]
MAKRMDFITRRTVMLYVVGDGAHTVPLYDFDERFVLPYLKRAEMLICPYNKVKRRTMGCRGGVPSPPVFSFHNTGGDKSTAPTNPHWASIFLHKEALFA